jgi:hypothetical protein
MIHQSLYYTVHLYSSFTNPSRHLASLADNVLGGVKTRQALHDSNKKSLILQRDEGSQLTFRMWSIQPLLAAFTPTVSAMITVVSLVIFPVSALIAITIALAT